MKKLVNVCGVYFDPDTIVSVIPVYFMGRGPVTEVTINFLGGSTLTLDGGETYATLKRWITEGSGCEVLVIDDSDKIDEPRTRRAPSRGRSARGC